MEVPLLLAAFGFGFAARAVKLPPLVGFLIAGFVLHALGVESSDALGWIADVGVLLLLFGVGLKLNLRTLAGPQVWVTTTAMSLGSTVLFGVFVLALGAIGLPLASELDLRGAAIVGFALSFASTVFAVQALERSNESDSTAGRMAIGVLVLQDIFAVAFLVATGDGWPSAWALLVIPAFFVFRLAASWVLSRAGRGEVFVLFGVAMAVAVGAGGFEAVGLKPDLGALVAGIALSSHPRASELAGTLIGYKDLLLVGFFLSIGLAGTPPPAAWLVGVLVLVLLPLRSIGFMWMITRFRFRARTGLHTSLTLSTYSEFGLIVGSAAVAAGLLSQDWVSAAAVAVAGSFITGSWITKERYRLYGRWSRSLSRIERHPIRDDDAIVDCGWARVLIMGMGRIGEGAYDEIAIERPQGVVGVDRDPEIVDQHVSAGRSVIRGDALDMEFWERFRFHPEVTLVVAAFNSQVANLEAVARVKVFLPNAKIAAIARYRDEVAELREAGVDVARNLYEEAGQALADDAVAVVFRPAEDQ
jgi:predicted Kef-type K+ transport protein